MRRAMAMMLVVLLAVCLGGCRRTPQETQTTMTTGTTTTAVVRPATTTVPDATTVPTKKPTKPKKTTTTVPQTTACRHENVSDATCTEAAVCLTCGLSAENPMGHLYVEGVCTRCGEKSPDYVMRVEVLGLALDQTRVDLTVNDKTKLVCTTVPENATDKIVTWTTSNAAVATVDEGTVTAASAGEAIITATSLNGKTASCTVVVSELVLEMPMFPATYTYASDADECVPMDVIVTGIPYSYTQISTYKGTLVMVFQAVASADGVYPATPSVGWRLINRYDNIVAEGVCEGTTVTEAGSPAPGMTVSVQNVEPGRYRLELYSVYESENTEPDIEEENNTPEG